MTTCTRRIQFCAGHRVLGHENKCANVHGHNYIAFITAQAEQLDGLGRVIDFSVIKARVGGWIEEHWDHGFIVYVKDELLREALLVLDTKVFISPFNPTAEEMAAFLLRFSNAELMRDLGITITRVVIHETENCSAEVSQ